MKPIPADLSTWSSIVEIVASLRARDGGCPWDLEQTHRTLIPFAIEEVYELAEALEAEDQASTIEELGDVLLQVLLHAQIASETTVESNRYSWRDVVRTLGEKMVRRHPHVFGASNGAKSAETSEQVLAQWQVIKSQEKINSENKKAKSFFNIPIAMPALQRSFKIGEKTNRLKFDWPDWKGALAKVEEELIEVKEAIDKFGSAEVEHEIGDLLFSIAQLARHRGLEPETCLRKANARFERRFDHLREVEAEASLRDGRNWSSRTLEELDSMWNEAKKRESETTRT